MTTDCIVAMSSCENNNSKQRQQQQQQQQQIQQPHRGRNNISRGQFAPAPVHDYRSFTRVAQRCIAQRLLLENIALLI